MPKMSKDSESNHPTTAGQYHQKHLDQNEHQKPTPTQELAQRLVRNLRLRLPRTNPCHIAKSNRKCDRQLLLHCRCRKCRLRPLHPLGYTKQRPCPHQLPPRKTLRCTRRLLGLGNTHLYKPRHTPLVRTPPQSVLAQMKNRLCHPRRSQRIQDLPYR